MVTNQPPHPYRSRVRTTAVRTAAERRKIVAHGVSRGLRVLASTVSPGGAKEASSPRRIGLFCRPSGAVPDLWSRPTAYAVGYVLAALRALKGSAQIGIASAGTLDLTRMPPALAPLGETGGREGGVRHSILQCSPLRLFQRQHCVSRRGIAHEAADVALDRSRCLFSEYASQRPSDFS